MLSSCDMENKGENTEMYIVHTQLRIKEKRKKKKNQNQKQQRTHTFICNGIRARGQKAHTNKATTITNKWMKIKIELCEQFSNVI